jgi:ribonucleoside-diphosphate reductase subunit M2
MDPILNSNSSRFTLFPIKYTALWDLYKRAESSFWVAAEVDLTQDNFDGLTPNEQHFVKHVLAFFAAADGVVMENLCGSFMNDVQVSEARAFYAFQAAMEQIHSETYSLLIDTYVKDKKEKETLFNAIDEFPCVQGKYDWARQYMGDQQPFATRLVAFACVEGIFFSGAFCAIFWLKKRGLMADRLAKELDAGVIYNTANPFDWMELISLQGKTNFFENRVSEYQLSANVGGDREFTINDDF